MSSEQTGGVPAGTVQKSTWVVVQVSGQYNATPNPACGSQPPNWPCILNPPASSFYAPAPFTSGPVQAWVESGGISAIPLRGTGGAANTAGQAVGLYFAPAAGTLMIRSAVENYITPNPNPGAQVSSWIISGSYNASATKISNPLTFSGGPTGAPDGTVTFTVGTTAPLLFINPDGVPASSPPGDVDWYIVPGDAVPLTYERTSPAYQIFACYRKTTCTYTPPPNLNGRMQVAAYVEGQLVIGRSEQIRGTATPVGRLEVNCRPDSLIIGNSTTCTASVSPTTSTFTVQKWHFAGDSIGISADTTGDLKSWTFSPRGKGQVTVEATVAGAPQSATLRLTVECNFLEDVTGDSILDNRVVQQALRSLWRSTNAGGTNPLEKGMMVTDGPQGYHIHPYLGPSTNCSSQSGMVQWSEGDTLVAFVHTHPYRAGGTSPCNGNTDPDIVVADGPSKNSDVAAAHSLRNQFHRSIGGYIVDPYHVHRYASRLKEDRFNRNSHCL